MDRIKAIEKLRDDLRKIGAAGMRIAANGPTIDQVVCRALLPSATEANFREAKLLARMALDQYRAAPEHTELVTATKAAIDNIV